jgi:hypothetical protein
VNGWSDICGSQNKVNADNQPYRDIHMRSEWVDRAETIPRRESNLDRSAI